MTEPAQVHRRWLEQLAPHVEPEWADAFVLELRLQGVSGARIGDVLTEVDSHCVESGESAAVAFGDPVAYARSLTLPQPATTTTDLARAVAPTIVQVMGLLPTMWAIDNVRTGEPLALTAGHLVGASGLLLALVVLVFAADASLRLLVRHPLLATVIGMLVPITAVVAEATLREVISIVPAGLVLGLGISLIVVGTGWHVLRDRRGQSLGDDPITRPLPDDTATTGTSHLDRAADVLTTWMVPIGAVILLTIGWTTAG